MSKYKLKPHSGAAKRFRRRGSGYKHRSANRSHLLTDKGNRRKRKLRGLKQIAAADSRRVSRLLQA